MKLKIPPEAEQSWEYEKRRLRAVPMWPRGEPMRDGKPVKEWKTEAERPWNGSAEDFVKSGMGSSAPVKKRSAGFMKMNKCQFAVVRIGGVIVAIMCIFPPWKYTFQWRDVEQVTKPAGYSMVFTPPAPEEKGEPWGVGIDFERLFAQIISVSILCGLGFLGAGGTTEKR